MDTTSFLYHTRPQSARVKYPDGTYRTFEVDERVKGSVLFDQAAADFSLDDRKYFGLCFYNIIDETRHWVHDAFSIRSRLHCATIPRERREESNWFGQKETNIFGPRQEAPQMVQPWYFSLEFKWYPTSPSQLNDDLARNYLLCQLKRDMMNGRLKTTIDDFALLSALLVQLRFGDAQTTTSTDIREFVVSLNPNYLFDVSVRAKTIEQHEKLVGVTTTEALDRFMEVCAGLPTYGLEFFSVKDQDQNKVALGVGTYGIKIFQDNVVSHSYPLHSFALYGGEKELKMRMMGTEADVVFEVDTTKNWDRLFHLHNKISLFSRGYDKIL